VTSSAKRIHILLTYFCTFLVSFLCEIAGFYGGEELEFRAVFLNRCETAAR